MAVLADVQGVPVVGAEAEIGRRDVGQDGGERFEVFRDGAFADQDAHPLAELFQRLLGCRRLMFGADAGGDIGVEVAARELRAVAVDMAALEKRELGDAAGVAVDDAGIVHEFGETDAGGMAHDAPEVAGMDGGARGFHMGRGHAGGQLHADVHQRVAARLLKVSDAGQADDIGDLMRVADRGGDAARGDAAVEFEGRDEGAFDVEMRVDEAGDEDEAGDVDDLAPFVGVADADDGVARDRHVAVDHRAGHHVEDLTAAQEEIGGRVAPALCDASFQICHADRLSVFPSDETKAPRASSG